VDFVSLEYKRIVEQLKIFLPFWGKIQKNTLLQRLKEAGVKDKSWRDYFENPDDDELRIKADLRTSSAKREASDKTGDIIADLIGDAIRKFEVCQNGLGYNNLIFVATVLGDIIERKEAEPGAYVALLIEEPEAHLHPQLQDTLFGYFRKMRQRKIQVFITSHSPTITAKTRLRNLSVLERATEGPSCTPLALLPLNRRDWPKLERFLDVTKCQLFFAKGVILVEGISEALLLPILAKKMGRKYDLERNGVEVVNIGGVAFRPFARLFNSSDESRRLKVRCAIVTDDDRPIKAESDDEKISARAKKAKKLAGANLAVNLARVTFEYELFMANRVLVGELYGEMHPRIRVTDVSTFLKAIGRRRDKAEFAQRFAEQLEEKGSAAFEKLVVPEYIQKAIRWVIDG
jgi:putative ATP-dependent endonuclease of OLD family